MNPDSFLRPDRHDFLAAFPAGFYILVTAAVAFFDTPLLGDGSVAEHLRDLPTLLLAVYSSYLLGQVVRAIPVRRADWINRWVLLREPFPYPRMLEGYSAPVNLFIVASGLRPGPVPLGLPDMTMSVFDFWKNYLYARDSPSFPRIRAIESRVRYLAGMFWASLIGTAGGAVLLFRDGSIWPALISSVLVLALSFALSRARREEASESMLSFVANFP